MASYTWPQALAWHGRRWNRSAAVILVAGLVAGLLGAAVLARPWAASIDVGGPLDTPYLAGFYQPESNDTTSYRWAGADATVTLPAVGPLDALELRVTGHQDGDRVTVDAGAGLADVRLRAGWQYLRVIPRADPLSGDVRVRLVSDAAPASAADPRRLGVVLDQIVLVGAGAASPLPALWLGVAAALCALLALWASRRLWAAALAGGLFAAAAGAVLSLGGGAWRPLLAGYAAPLALGLGLGALVALAAEQVLVRLAARGAIALAPPWARALALCALLAFLLRFLGLAFPLTVPNDLQFYLARATMVTEGKFWSLFLPNTALTPTQWHVDGPVPRSPFFYLITAPFMYLPGKGPALAIGALSSFGEACAALALALIVLHGLKDERAAVFAALLAGAHPLSLKLAVIWGIFGTLLAQALSLVAVALWLYQRPRLREWRAQALVAGAFALAYLAYPTGLLFLGLTWAILVLLLALARDQAAWPTLLAGVLAALLALALFYAWHIPALLTITLPKMLGAGGDGGLAGELPRASLTAGELALALWEPLRVHIGLAWLALALAGMACLAARWRGREARPATLLLAAWGLTYLPTAFANALFVTFILKHLLYAVPVAAALGGVALGWLARRGRWGPAAAWLVTGLLVLQGAVAEALLIAGG